MSWNPEGWTPKGWQPDGWQPGGNVGIVDESESALSITAAKVYTIGLIDETETVLTLSAAKAADIGVVDESETTRPVFVGTRVIPGGARFGIGLPGATFEI